MDIVTKRKLNILIQLAEADKDFAKSEREMIYRIARDRKFEEEVVNALIELRELVTVSSDVAFRQRDYDLMETEIRKAIKQNGRISLAETRDLFQTSRKYAQALLEHFDTAGVTMRDGDFRTLRK